MRLGGHERCVHDAQATVCSSEGRVHGIQATIHSSGGRVRDARANLVAAERCALDIDLVDVIDSYLNMSFFTQLDVQYPVDIGTIIYS